MFRPRARFFRFVYKMLKVVTMPDPITHTVSSRIIPEGRRLRMNVPFSVYDGVTRVVSSLVSYYYVIA